MSADSIPPADQPIPELLHLSRAESDALSRRRRGRNLALLIGLLALAGIFYAIAIVKLAHPVAR